VIRRSFRWVPAGRAADDVETRYTRLLEEWRDRRDTCGTLGDAVDRFLKVTDSYRPGLFHYLRVPCMRRRESRPQERRRSAAAGGVKGCQW
jgi:hypothetical protein